MKRTVLFLAALATLTCGWSQNLAKNEAKSLQAFMKQTSAKGVTNAQALGASSDNVASLPGLTISNGHVTEIKWDNKDLAGNLDLSGFSSLEKVDVSGNKLNSLTVVSPTVVEINASKNRLTSVGFDCQQLQVLKLNRNRIADIDITGTPLLKKLNIASNQIVELNVGNSANLTYLNCMSNNLEELSVTNCTALKTLYAGYNDLTGMTLSGLVKLENLNVQGNKIQKLYIQDLPSLVTLACNDNHMTGLAVNGCKVLNDIFAPYNDLTSFTVTNTPNLAFVNLEWNDLTYVDLSNLNFLQRVNVSNNQLQTLDVSFDPLLSHLNIHNNVNLTDLRTTGDNQLRQIVGEWSNFLDPVGF